MILTGSGELAIRLNEIYGGPESKAAFAAKPPGNQSGAVRARSIRFSSAWIFSEASRSR